MFGLKDLSMNRLATVLLTVSAVLMVLGFAAPEDGTVTGLVAWLVSALVLMGLWAAVALELARRYFGHGDHEH